MSRARDRLKRTKRYLWVLAAKQRARLVVWKECRICKGTGIVSEVPITRFGGLFQVPIQPRTCRSCFGGGRVVDNQHHVYMGMGTITGSER